MIGQKLMRHQGRGLPFSGVDGDPPKQADHSHAPHTSTTRHPANATIPVDHVLPAMILTVIRGHLLGMIEKQLHAPNTRGRDLTGQISMLGSVDAPPTLTANNRRHGSPLANTPQGLRKA